MLFFKNQKRAELRDDFGEARVKSFEEVVKAFKTLGEEMYVFKIYIESFSFLCFDYLINVIQFNAYHVSNEFYVISLESLER